MITTTLADWNEDDHPRDARGRFASGVKDPDARPPDRAWRTLHLTAADITEEPRR